LRIQSDLSERHSSLEFTSKYVYTICTSSLFGETGPNVTGGTFLPIVNCRDLGVTVKA